MWTYHSDVFMFFKYILLPGEVAHTCNPIYLGGRDKEDLISVLNWEKSWWDSHLNKGAEHGGVCL
jgi:hypothetical protein